MLPNQKRLENITGYNLCVNTQNHISTNPSIGSSLTKPNHELDYSNNTLENIVPDNYFKGLNFYRVIKVDS